MAKRCPNGLHRVYEQYRYWIKGDQAGSDASPGVVTRRSFRPVTSIDQICEPRPPDDVRPNMITRPFGAQVGPSSSQPFVMMRVPEPSGCMTPIWNPPL